MYVTDNSRDMEVEVVPKDNTHIDCTPEPSIKLPESISLSNSVRASAYVYAVCHYKGVTYLGTMKRTVEAIDSDFNLKTLVSLSGNRYPVGICIHDDTIYVIVSGVLGRYTINVYDLSGQLITQWNRSDSCFYIKPAIVSDQVVLPNYRNKQLTAYSLRGEVIKHVSCPQLSGSWIDHTSVCAVDDETVVVTSYNKSKVFKVNINTGETVWTCNDVAKPIAVAIYGKDYVCVGSYGKISFLNINTG